jgi:pyrroline-5-carboxylate reductase
MPNTPCLVGECAAAFALGGSCLPEDAVLVKRIFSAVGAAFEVKEKDLNGEFVERTDIEVNCS